MSGPAPDHRPLRELTREELEARLVELEAVALGNYLHKTYGSRSYPHRPPGGAVDRLCIAAHDLANRYLPVIEAQELLAQRMRPPGHPDPHDALRRVVALCDDDGWLAQRRVNLRAELDRFDAAMDAALAVARGVLAIEEVSAQTDASLQPDRERTDR